jgi:ATP-dependent helicase/nuclease subunit A
MSPRLEALLADDRRARRAAQQEHGPPLVLEAGAGTGKTATLVARLLAWCLGAGWAGAEAKQAEAREPVAASVLDGLVALTFTEAAAAEMAERFAAALAKVATGTAVPGFAPELLELPAETLAARARELTGQLDRLAISTLHAFCARLLKSYPLEAGVHPAFGVDADGSATAALVRELLDEELPAAYQREGPALALAEAGLGPADLARALGELVAAGVSAAALERDPFDGPSLAAWHARLAARLTAFAASAAPLAVVSARSKRVHSARHWVASLTERLAAAPAGGAGAEALEAFLGAWLEGSDEGDLKRLKDWGKGELGKGEQEALGSALEAFARAAGDLAAELEAASRLAPRRLDAARRALAPWLAQVEREKRQRGVLAYGDLLTGARDLLERQPRVRARERRRLAQILVDEFQDTDRLQCDLLRALALDGPVDERPGLFLVGDPKQSIYGWRSADLAAYDGFLDEVAAAGGRVERLSINFRSLPEILLEVERTVAPVMTRQPGVQPAFQPLVANPEGAALVAGEQGRVERWVSWTPLEVDDAGKVRAGGPKTRSRAASELEARAVAQDLARRGRDGGLAWSQAALLLRSMGDVDLVLRALEAAGVPYAVARDRSYYRHREVIDAAALVRAVLDPGDTLALATVLRAPWVGVPDAALVALWREGLPALVAELEGAPTERLRAAIARAANQVPGTLGEPKNKVPGTLGGPENEVPGTLGALENQVPENQVPGFLGVAAWPAALLDFLATLGRLRLSFATESTAAFLERLRSETLAEGVEAARYLGRFRVANLERFFRRLATTLDAGGSVHEALRFLRSAVAEARDEAAGAPAEAPEEAVQVMTLHGAKGLEFDHVYLLQTHKDPPGRRGDRGCQAELVADGAEPRHELSLFGWPSLGWQAVLDRRAEREAAELARLLYVAETRAARRLVVAGAPSDSRARTPRSLADLLAGRSGAAPPLLEAFRTGGPGSEILGEDGVRWWFPEIVEGERRALEASAGFDLGPVAAALAERSIELQAAARRSRRSLRGAVSAEAHERLEASQRESAEALSPPARRELALAVGTAVHAALEHADWREPAQALLGTAEAALQAALVSLPDARNRDEAAERARALLHRLVEGPLGERLRTLAPAILARELPVLLPGTSEGDGPVGFLAGSIDLLYRDPETGELVVADYKTDEVTNEAELEARAHAYTPQLAAYGRALEEALELPQPPRLELWFLAPGWRVVC